MMNIQYHLKSVILASALALSGGIMQTSFAAPGYQVINVATWDALNMRSGAGTGFDITGSIPANTNGITLTNSESQIGDSTWVKIIWNGQSGWVNKRFLTIAEATANPDNIQLATGGSEHTHPANRCTGSVTHSHSAPAGHVHRYNCQNNYQQETVPTVPLQQGMKQTYYDPNKTDIYGRPYGTQQVVLNNNNNRIALTNNSNTHSHPANECTRSKTHSHANGSVRHNHRYSCQGRGRQAARQQPTYYGASSLQHTHPRSQCVSAISHSHKNGDRVHRHECPSSRRGGGVGGRHTHPANSMTRATTHSHPYQDRRHSHTYGR